MKSEERHELQANELGKLADRSAAALQQHSNRIVTIVCGVIIVAAAIVAWMRYQSSAATAAWTALLSSQTPEAYAETATLFKGTSVAGWATLQAADEHLSQGVRMMFSDRDAALSELKKAQQKYEELSNQSGLEPVVRERALFGMARAQESTSGSDLQSALGTYEKLLSEFPNTVYKEVAEERIGALKTADAQNFYAWFAKQNPKPAEPKKPADGSAGGPQTAADDAEIAEESMPEKPAPDKPADKASKEPAAPQDEPEDKPASTPDAAPKDPPADEKDSPADADAPADKDAAEKPAVEKPADEKPAAEKPADEK